MPGIYFLILILLFVNSKEASYKLSYDKLIVEILVPGQKIIELNDRIISSTKKLIENRESILQQSNLLSYVHKAHLLESIENDAFTLKDKIYRLGFTAEQTLSKRDTLINIGAVSHYFGIASTQDINEISMDIKKVNHNLNLSKSKFESIEAELLNIEKLLYKNNKGNIDSSKFFINILNLQQLSKTLMDQVLSLEIALIEGKLGLPPFSFINTTALDQLINDSCPKNSQPLLTSVNLRQILPLSKVTAASIEKNIMSIKLNLPYIRNNLICKKNSLNGRNLVLKCNNTYAYVNKNRCQKIFNDISICSDRPCLTKHLGTCEKISSNSFIIRNISACMIGDLGENKLVKMNNQEKVIYLNNFQEMSCDGITIPKISVKNTKMYDNLIKDLNHEFFMLNLTNHPINKDLKKISSLHNRSISIELNSDKNIDHHIIATYSNTGVILAIVFLGGLLLWRGGCLTKKYHVNDNIKTIDVSDVEKANIDLPPDELDPTNSKRSHRVVIKT